MFLLLLRVHELGLSLSARILGYAVRLLRFVELVHFQSEAIHELQSSGYFCLFVTIAVDQPRKHKNRQRNQGALLRNSIREPNCLQLSNSYTMY